MRCAVAISARHQLLCSLCAACATRLCLSFFAVLVVSSLLFTHSSLIKLIHFSLIGDSWRQSFGGSSHSVPQNLPMDMQNVSEIANFYGNKSIFITGATGFMGKVRRKSLFVSQFRGASPSSRVFCRLARLARVTSHTACCL